MSLLRDHYKTVAVPKLRSEMGFAPLAVPRLRKVVVSAGVGGAAQDIKILEETSRALAQITGQIPKVTRARKAIASFKIRKGAPVGLMVTLRGRRMEDFLARLLHVVLPRMRDFRGLNGNGFDQQGNYSLGLREQIVFPEIKPDQATAMQGLEITIETTAKNPPEGRALLEALGFPFKKDKG